MPEVNRRPSTQSGEQGVRLRAVRGSMQGGLGWLRAALIALVGAIWPSWAQATPQKGLEIRFDVRARESVVGRGALVVGAKVRQGKLTVRQVQVWGKTEDLAGVLWHGEAQLSSWLDPLWNPIVAKWTSEFRAVSSQVDVHFTPHLITADIARRDKPPLHIERTTTAPAADLVSLVPWLMQQKVKPGQKLQGIVVLGQEICQFDAEVRPVEKVHTTPRGDRDGLPVDLVFSHCKLERPMTIWLDNEDFTPLRAVLAKTHLGTVDMVLTGVQRIQRAWLPMPEAEQPETQGKLPSGVK